MWPAIIAFLLFFSSAEVACGLVIGAPIVAMSLIKLVVLLVSLLVVPLAALLRLIKRDWKWVIVLTTGILIVIAGLFYWGMRRIQNSHVRKTEVSYFEPVMEAPLSIGGTDEVGQWLPEDEGVFPQAPVSKQLPQSDRPNTNEFIPDTRDQTGYLSRFLIVLGYSFIITVVPIFALIVLTRWVINLDWSWRRLSAIVLLATVVVGVVVAFVWSTLYVFPAEWLG